MKKIAALGLAIALTMCMTTAPVFAAGNDKGSIGFKIDSTTPPGPSDKTVTGIHNQDGIDFGEQNLSSTNQTYDSTTQARAATTQYAGLVVESFGVAGEIQLTVSNFQYTETTLNTNHPNVMTGYTMKLTPGTIAKSASTPGNPALCTAETKTYVAGAAQKIFTVPANNVGVFGVNYAGELLVPGNSVPAAGETQATMLWETVPLVP